MQDQRHTPRYRVECPVSFAVEDVSGTGTVFNLSEEGCAIESGIGIPHDGYASLSLILPGDLEPVTVELARIRWVAQTGFGCEFRILSRAARARLQRYLCLDRAA